MDVKKMDLEVFNGGWQDRGDGTLKPHGGGKRRKVGSFHFIRR